MQIAGYGLPRIPFPRLSENGGRSQQRSLTNHPKALFVLRILANSSVGALLSPIFGQSLHARL
jgi:hypothetical protein